MNLQLYSHPKCSTCRKAGAFLKANEIPFELHDIREQTPSPAQMELMMQKQNGALRKLFNTSGRLYRERGLKEQIGSMSTAAAFELLSSDGMLIKRPFLIGEETALLGFREAEWSAELL